MALKLAGFSKQQCCSRLKNLSTLLELHVSASLDIQYTHAYSPYKYHEDTREASTPALVFLPHILPSASSLSNSSVLAPQHIWVGLLTFLLVSTSSHPTKNSSSISSVARPLSSHADLILSLHCL
jgi:hypothetical protein